MTSVAAREFRADAVGAARVARSPGLNAAVARHWKPAVLLLYAAWVLIVGQSHEPWFDEAQAWLLARDSSLWQLLAERVRYEGSPGLWHTILWFAIRGGLPFRDFQLIAAGFAIAGAAVVLWRAPFPPLLRVAMISSYFFAYQFPVIARSYAVDLLLVPLAAAWFADRAGRPLRYAVVVGLIANLNAHGFLAAGVLGVEFAWHVYRTGAFRRPRAIAALAMLATLGLAALAVAWQPADNAFLQPGAVPQPAEAAFLYFRNAFIDRAMLFGSGPAGLLDTIAGISLGVALVLPGVRLIRAGDHAALALGLALALFGFSAFKYANAWHAGLLFLFWMFCLWISWESDVPVRIRRHAVIALAILCSWQAVQAVRTGIWDIGHVASPGEQAAAAIDRYRAEHPGARVGAMGYKSFAVQPWMSGNAFANYHHGAAHPSYIAWDKAEPWQPGTTGKLWQKAIDGKPELLLASLVTLDGKVDRLLPRACRGGYGVRQVFPGALPWRGGPGADDTLVLFERGSRRGC